jgi:hypothetical protein
MHFRRWYQAEILGLKFAYATNGKEIIEFDFFTGIERVVADFPRPAELWARQRAGLGLTDDSLARMVPRNSGCPTRSAWTPSPRWAILARSAAGSAAPIGCAPR